MTSRSLNTNQETITPIVVCEEMLNYLFLYKSQLYTIAEGHNLTPVQLHTLRIISKGQNAMGKIAKVLHCDASNMTGIVDRLISLELVTRHENENDRRIKSIQLTVKGNATLKQIMNELPERLGWNEVSQEELNNTHQIIKKLANLNQF
jgi:DNA-binding MarR family transcriptional regulator